MRDCDEEQILLQAFFSLEELVFFKCVNGEFDLALLTDRERVNGRHVSS